MEIKEKIIQEAARMFIKFGIRGITMDDIARELSMSKRTIYENFRDKNTLLSACLELIQQKQSANRSEIVRSSANTIEAILNFLTRGTQILTEINPAFMADLKKYHYKVWIAHTGKYAEKNLAETYNFLRNGISEGVIRKDINVEIVSRILHEQLNIMTDEDLFPSTLYSRKDVFENIVINFARGISTSRGLQIIDNYMKAKSESFQ